MFVILKHLILSILLILCRQPEYAAKGTLPFGSLQMVPISMKV